MKTLTHDEARELGRRWAQKTWVKVALFLFIFFVVWQVMWPSESDVVERTTAAQSPEIQVRDLLELFGANEPAGEAFAKRPGFAVRGEVSKVETSVFSPVVVQLKGSIGGGRVAARLGSDQVDSAARLRPGAKIVLRCGGGALRVMGTIWLDGCKIPPDQN